jgi:fibronectin type 3 domain-containing protein
MKNKLVMAALAAALLCGLAFSACKNDVQDVRINYDKAEAVEEVKAVNVTAAGANAVILTWNAVDDAGGYNVYLKVDGAKTLRNIGGGWTGVTYTAAGGESTNTDLDKWTKYVSFGNNEGEVSLPTGTYAVTFGVQTRPLDQYSGGAPSDIVWSNALTIKLP